MFDNIGDKIKGLAIFVTIVGCVVSLIFAISYWNASHFWDGFLIFICGPLLSWVGSFVLYGFGELIEKTNRIEESNRKIQMLMKKCDLSDSEKDEK